MSRDSNAECGQSALVNLNDLIDVLRANKRAIRSGLFHRTIKFSCEGTIENVVH